MTAPNPPIPYTLKSWVVDPIVTNQRFFVAMPWRHIILSCETVPGSDQLTIWGLADVATENKNIPFMLAKLNGTVTEPYTYIGSFRMEDKDQTYVNLMEMVP